MLEAKLVESWRELLKNPSIDKHSDFLASGGDSLRLLVAFSTAQQLCNQNLNLDGFLDSPTISTLLGQIGDEKTLTRKPDGLDSLNEEVIIPLIPVQNWFFQKVHDREAWYNNLSFETQHLRKDMLEAAVSQISRSHPALRNGFRQIDGKWQSFIRPGPNENAFTYRALYDLSPEQQRRLIAEFVHAATSTLDIENGSLFTVFYFDLSEEGDGALVVSLHHLITDWISNSIVCRDLLSSYFKLAENQFPAGPIVRNSVVEVANSIANFGNTLVLPAEFVDRIGEYPVRSLPVDFEVELDSNRASNTSALVGVLQSAERSNLLQNLTRLAPETSIIDAIVWSLAKTISSWSHTSVARIMSIDSGRFTPPIRGLDTSSVVGWLSAMPLFFLSLDDTLSAFEQVAELRRQRIESPFQGVWYEQLVWGEGDGSGLPEAARIADIDRVILNFTGTAKVLDGTRFPGIREVDLDLLAHSSTKNNRDCGFYIECSESDGTLRVIWAYSRRLHRDETVRKLVDGFLCNLRLLASGQPAPEM